MSKALRGDFERLRERGVSVTLAPRESSSPGSEAVEPSEPVLEATTVEPPEAQAAEPGSEPADEPETADEPEKTDEPKPASEPGWLGRLFGR